MLKRAWYLITHTDYRTGPAESPRSSQAPEVTDLFGDDAKVSPAHTGTALEITLRMAEHLSDAIAQGTSAVADREQFARLLHGFNLLLAHAAQISGRLAYHADTGTGTAADLRALTDLNRAAVAQALATASCRLEESAGLLQEAHLAVTSTTRQAARR